MSKKELESLWSTIKHEMTYVASYEPILAKFLCNKLLKHKDFSSALSFILANKLADYIISNNLIIKLIKEVYKNEPSILISAARDIYAICLQDPVIKQYSTPLLYLKGFHAIQAYRISHWLWYQNRKDLAIYFQSQISKSFGVDIHPAAFIGHGIMLDHATSIVIGETTVIENNVSILQSVTLGGTGKIIGDRHPKIRNGVAIGAGAIILGNIEIGEGAKIGAGSVVLHSVQANTTVAGVPAKIIKPLIKTHYEK